MEPTAEPKANGAEAKKPVAKAHKDTFESVAREWYATRQLGWTPRYAGVLMRRLEADIFSGGRA